jgi:hypothetical protein
VSAMLTILSSMLPFLPLLLYAVVGIITWRYLRIIPPDAVQADLDKQQSSSLTLAGFCFASLSLTLSFFQKQASPDPSGIGAILFCFSLALACFVASYMTLRYRTKNIFHFASDGLIDCGFWSIMLGLLEFFRIQGFHKLSRIYVVLLVFYLFYVGFHFYLHIQYARKNSD